MQSVLLQRLGDIENNKVKAQEYLQNPQLAKHFCHEFYILFSWSSNHIEGNSLSLNDTTKLIERDEVTEGKSMSDHENILNHFRTLKQFLGLSPKTITENWIKEVHQAVMLSHANINPGNYRNDSVFIGTPFEIIYQAPSYKMVPTLMDSFIKKINIKASNAPLETIIKDHIEFESIHPFLDGNGRTGRIILNQQLINSGYLPIAIKNNSKYFSGIKRFQNANDITPLLSCITSAELGMWKFLCNCFCDN